MSIEFMVIAAPRSGTAWASNWLTTDRTLCLHDPLWTRHWDELDGIVSRQRRAVGMACTGIALWPAYVHSHPARKVVLHRDLTEVNGSLIALGMRPLGPLWKDALDTIDGRHHHWRDLFSAKSAKGIYEYLLEREFDEERWERLTQLNVQVALETIKPDPTVAQRLARELR